MAETWNVKECGAVGDGSTDDTVAIQTVYDAVVSAGAVYFPPGVYLVHAPLTVADKAVATMGAGIDLTVLRCQHGGNGFTFTDSSPVSTPIHYWSFADMTVAKDGTGGDGISCVRFVLASNPTIPSLSLRHVLCRGFADIATQYWERGIYEKNGAAVTLRDVAVIANGPAMACGILLDNDTNAARYNLHLDGINIQGGQVGLCVTGHCENVRVTNYEIVGQHTSLFFDGTGTAIPQGQNPVCLISHGHANAKTYTIRTLNWKVISILGADTYSGVGVDDTAGSNILIVNARYVSIMGGKVGTGMVGLPRQGIELQDVQDVQISTTLEYFTNGGVTIVGATSDRLQVYGSTFLGYTAASPMSSGIYVGASGCRSTIVGNSFEHCRIGVQGVAAGSLIAANNFHHCTTDVLWAALGSTIGQNQSSNTLLASSDGQALDSRGG